METFHPDEAGPETTEKEQGTSGLMNFLVDVLETLILSVVLFVGINAISARIRVDGDSMEPSLHNGEFVVVNRLGYRFGMPQHGDVIVFHFPRDPEQEYIKRVIGLPGDQIRVADGKVYLNDQPLDEPYIYARPAYTGSWVVPDNQIFVLGDNRNASSDSHNWGMVPLEYVIGKAIFIYWPIQELGPIQHVTLAKAAP